MVTTVVYEVVGTFIHDYFLDFFLCKVLKCASMHHEYMHCCLVYAVALFTQRPPNIARIQLKIDIPFQVVANIWHGFCDQMSR